MPLTLFFSSVSGSLELKKNQDRIFFVLESKKIPFEAVDISQNPEHKDLMRKRAGNPKALPPQLCNGDIYCGVSFSQCPVKVMIRCFDHVPPSQN
uniref:GST N-terminal domain-containing protein n=1 Tax=Seriola lalandi dorsalis TaxID=1841481 RepID=A0A3B4WFD9_SERLL